MQSAPPTPASTQLVPRPRARPMNTAAQWSSPTTRTRLTVSGPRSVERQHHHAVLVLTDRIHRDPAGPRLGRARVQIEAPLVERTDQRVHTEQTVCKWTLAVRALGLGRVYLALPRAKHGDTFVADLEGAALAFGNLLR